MNVIIFGSSDNAQMAKWYLENDSIYKPVAYCVDSAFITQNTIDGLPVIPFEEIEQKLPPENNKFFAPIYTTKMNKLREEIVFRIKNKGYKFITYVNSKANISNAAIGENCFLLEYVNLQPFTIIEDNVIVWSQSHIGHHSVIRKNNFVSSHVIIAGHCIIDSYCFLGSNSSYRENIHIAEGCFIGMGSTVVKNTEPWSLYLGTPAKKQKNINSETFNNEI